MTYSNKEITLNTDALLFCNHKTKDLWYFGKTTYKVRKVIKCVIMKLIGWFEYKAKLFFHLLWPRLISLIRADLNIVFFRFLEKRRKERMLKPFALMG